MLVDSYGWSWTTYAVSLGGDQLQAAEIRAGRRVEVRIETMALIIYNRPARQ